MTDRTMEELNSFKGMHSGLLYQSHKRRQLSGSKFSANISSLPKSVDWRSKNVLTPVKNQGQCGSCWTFASTETIESHVAIKTGVLQELSEQFILDCTPNPKQCGGTGGCQGGTAELAYTRLKELGGIPGEYTYPYISGTGQAGKCHGLPLPPASISSLKRRPAVWPLSTSGLLALGSRPRVHSVAPAHEAPASLQPRRSGGN